MCHCKCLICLLMQISPYLEICLSANLKIRIYNHKLHYLLAIILSLHNVGAFFSLTMTRKPTHLTHINATVNRHDVLHPSEESFATVDRVRLDLACHSFSTEVEGFLLQNFHILGNQGNLVYCISCRRYPVL